MILHRLEFEAFMAYPDRQTIDFGDLNAAGVFLLNGPTGAGKTTILDAICYALYGGTTGDRDPAQLYSTYAARSNTPPRVFLDLTLQGRRLRINRTPVYSHPITRGKRAGQMTVKAATATVEELLPGGNPGDDKAWKPIASQVKEVNAVIAERIHLNREQFLKVVLLAQGQFAQFLKSKPVERKELLKKMFPVDHIEAMYAELLEEAKQARQDVANDEQALDGYLNRARSGMEALRESLTPLTPEGRRPKHPPPTVGRRPQKPRIRLPPKPSPPKPLTRGSPPVSRRRAPPPRGTAGNSPASPAKLTGTPRPSTSAFSFARTGASTNSSSRAVNASLRNGNRTKHA